MPGPLFFVDRSLGRVRVPALLRESGWALVTLSEHYGVPQDEAVDDVAWLRLAGDCFIRDQHLIWTEAARTGPALFAVSRHDIREIDLDD